MNAIYKRMWNTILRLYKHPLQEFPAGPLAHGVLHGVVRGRHEAEPVHVRLRPDDPRLERHPQGLHRGSLQQQGRAAAARSSKGQGHRVWRRLNRVAFVPIRRFLQLGTGWGGHLFRRFCKLFSERSTGCWAILQLPCFPSKQGELSDNIVQNLRNKWPPHPVD